MGSGTFTSSSWDSYRSTKGYTDKSTASDMYKSNKVRADFEPKGIKYRESCDSDEHPNSSPIILALDVTGSMGNVLTTISQKLNVLIEQIYNRKPVSDPQIMFMAFGDVTCDRHPLQVTQFESDIRIAEQLNDIYFERGGGGNDGESYTLPWYFASRHTKLDSMDKHNKKGFLFTFGDEKYLNNLSASSIKEFIGDDVQADLSAEQLLTEVTRQYEVYHLLIEEGSGMSYDRNGLVKQWTNLLGQRAISVSDCSKIPEIIVSILELMSGKEKDDILKSWDGTTSIVVEKAINGLTTVNTSNDLVEY